MPLEILALLVVGGIGLIILLVRMAFGSGAAFLEDEAEAIRVFRDDYPDCKPSAAYMSADKKAAIIDVGHEAGEVGYVQAFGTRHVTRRLTRGDLRNWRMVGDTAILVHLNDAGLPKIDIEFADPKRAHEVRQLFEGLTG